MFSNSQKLCTMTYRIKISDEIVVAFIKIKDCQLERRGFIWAVKSVLFVFPLINIVLGDDHSPLTYDNVSWRQIGSFKVKKSVRYYLVQLSKRCFCACSLGPVTNVYFLTDYNYTGGLQSIGRYSRKNCVRVTTNWSGNNIKR